MTELNYGPLAQLMGTYIGDKGMDVAPDPDEEKEENAYYETIVFSEAGATVNAEEETLMSVHYFLHVHRKGDDKLIHTQTGYWMWNVATNEIIQSIAISRAVCVLAKGTFKQKGDATIFDVSANASAIIQTDFMHKKAKTTSFEHHMKLANGTLTYSQTTMVNIYDSEFEHTDTNMLQKSD